MTMTTTVIPQPSPPLLPDRHLSLSAPKPQVYVVGSPNPKSPFLRIAHVSDTCGLQDSGYSIIYEADVIVHSGNLCPNAPNQLRKHFFRDTEFVSQLKAINEFFAALPHRYKIFVPGPNEAFAEAEDRERVQALLPNCIYLHDSGCIIEGVRFHGVGCAGRRFGGRSTAETKTAWSNVPDSVDVLVSHSVPTNSLYDDLVTRLRPKMLLYGSRMQRSSRSDQPAEENCVKFKDNVIFSNGHAGNSACKRGIFDFYADDQAPRETHLPQVSPEAVSQAYRSLPMPNSSGGGNSRYGGLLRCIMS